MSPATPRPWTCPACERTVPGRIDTCYCGSRRPKAPVRTTTARGNAATVKLVIAAGALVALGVGAWYSQQSPPPAVTTPSVRPGTPVPQSAARSIGSQPAAPDSAAPPLEDTIERAMPSVVMVQTSTTRGSGFFAGPDLIVTNAHVVAGSSAAAVTTRNGTRVDGKVVFQSEPRDIAFLQIPKETGAFPVLALGRSGAVRLGQGVVALGWAESLSQSTVTRGIVTALRREADQNLVQTDAVPNHGDSGGPLLDRNGNVVGVTTFRAEVENKTAGFAIAIDDVKPFFAYVPANVSTAAPAAAATAAPPPSLSPSAVAPSAADARRQIGLQHYDDALVAIDAAASQLDAEWRNYRTSCRITAVPAGQSHEWVALYDPQSPLHQTAPWCASALSTIEQRARAVNAAMATAAELARQSGVYAGDVRGLRAKHHLDWAGWDR